MSTLPSGIRDPYCKTDFVLFFQMAAAQCLCKEGQRVDLDCEECLNKAVADGTCKKCNNVGCPEYDKSLDSLLVQAAKDGKIKAMEALLKAGVNINCVARDRPQYEQYTPLTAASKGNQIEAVRFLVNWTDQVSHLNARECSADLSKSDDRKCSTPVSQSDDAERPADVGQSDTECSANVGRLDETKCLDFINKADGSGWTALLIATSHNHREIAQILVDAGADLNCKDEYGWQPVHHAAGKDYTGMLQILVKAGAIVNCKDGQGWQPIHYAARDGHTGIVEILVKAGSDVNCNNDNGVQPIHHAAYYGHTAVIELLLQAGASINAKDSCKKQTPLIRAAIRGHTQTVQLLLSKGADVEMQDSTGRRALHCAAEMRRVGIVAKAERFVDIVSALLQAGASINSMNNNMETPLKFSFHRRANMQIVKMLLEYGADLRIDHNYSALDMAILRSSGSAEQMAFLYAAGASICREVREDIGKYSKIIPQFILDDQEPMLDLLGSCRRKIRGLLLSPAWGNNKNLSSAVVAQLPLPQRLKPILLFGVDI